MNFLSTLRFALASLTLVLAAFGCAPPAGEDEGIEVGSYTEELRVRQGTGGSTDQCKTCGCSWRHDGYDNGCKVYRCVCTSEADAECVVDNGGPGRPSETASSSTYDDDVDVEAPWRTRIQTSTPYLYRGI